MNSYLWGHEGNSPTKLSGETITGLDLYGCAEVGDFHNLFVSIEEQVVPLKVSMHDLYVVQINQSRRYLLYVTRNYGRFQRPQHF